MIHSCTHNTNKLYHHADHHNLKKYLNRPDITGINKIQVQVIIEKGWKYCHPFSIE